MEKQIQSKSHLKSFINLVFSSFSQYIFTWLLLCLSRRQQHACTRLIHYRFSTWFFLHFKPLFALFSMRNCVVVTCLIFGSTWSYNSQFFAHFSVKRKYSRFISTTKMAMLNNNKAHKKNSFGNWVKWIVCMYIVLNFQNQIVIKCIREDSC